MATYSHELTLAECERWMRELDYVTDDDKLDWLRLMKDAKITANVPNRDNLRSRWAKLGAPRDRPKIRLALEKAEARRRTPTRSGQVLAGLEEWQQLGERLALNPDHFLEVRAAVSKVASLTEQAVTAGHERQVAVAEAEAAMAPFRGLRSAGQEESTQPSKARSRGEPNLSSSTHNRR